MKKIVLILLLVACVSFGTVLLVAPEKLPQSVQRSIYQPMTKLLATLRNTDNNTATSKQTHDTTHDQLYKHKNKDGTLVFSNKKSEHAEVHQHSNNSVFIDMKSGYAELEKNKTNTVKGKSAMEAVLDPVNSINSETTQKVAKMREAKRQKLAEQGI